MLCAFCMKEIKNINLPCPNCGYKFEAGDPSKCPNVVGAICTITENLCNKGADYAVCPIKQEADNESLI